jgi:hypothetical protein
VISLPGLGEKDNGLLLVVLSSPLFFLVAFVQTAFGLDVADGSLFAFIMIAFLDAVTVVDSLPSVPTTGGWNNLDEIVGILAIARFPWSVVHIVLCGPGRMIRSSVDPFDSVDFLVLLNLFDLGRVNDGLRPFQTHATTKGLDEVVDNRTVFRDLDLGTLSVLLVDERERSASFRIDILGNVASQRVALVTQRDILFVGSVRINTSGTTSGVFGEM